MSQSFSFSCRVYAEDTAFDGIVYHANYLNFMERARTEWLADQSLSIQTLAEQGRLFVIKNASLQYLKPIALNQMIIINSRVSRLGHATLYFEQNIVRVDAPEVICCSGKIQCVTVSPQLKPIAIPSAVKEAFS